MVHTRVGEERKKLAPKEFESLENSKSELLIFLKHIPVFTEKKTKNKTKPKFTWAVHLLRKESVTK